MNLPEFSSSKIDPVEAARTRAKLEYSAELTAKERQTELARTSPAALAYIGDAVYELYVRTCLLLPPKRMTDYHSLVIAKVRAEAQASKVELLLPHLTATEKEILRRGRNACSGKPRRISLKIYQQATSLETLIGYLYLTDIRRLEELLAKLEILN